MTKPLITYGPEDTPKVPLREIHMGERFRKDYGKKETEDLASSLREDGLIHPIALRPPTPEEIELGLDKKYVLVAGGRRLAAAMMLGWTEIPAHVREEMTDLRARILELYENLKRKEMTFSEEVNLTKEILRLRQEEDPSITGEIVAAELGMSGATLSRNVQVADALEKNPELKKAGSKHAVLRSQKVAARAESKAGFQKATVTRKAGDFRANLATADMRDWLRQQAESSADLVCADLPYGIDYWSQGHKNKVKGVGGNMALSEFDDTEDAARDLYADFVPLAVRVTRDTGWIVCFTGRELFPYLSDLFTNCCAVHYEYQAENKKKKGKRANHCLGVESHLEGGGCRFLVPEPVEWIWYRPNSRNNPRFPEFHARNDFERILVVNMGKGVLYGELPHSNVLVHDQIYHGERVHSNQKPVELMTEIVKRLTQEGDLVIDPCFGSGATLAGAAAVARDFKGCEQNPAMLDAAIGLIAQNWKPLSDTVREQAKKMRAVREMSDIDEGVFDFEEEDVDA